MDDETPTPEISEKDKLKEMRRLYVAVLRKALESDRPPTASMLGVIGKFLDANDVKADEVDPKDTEMATLLARLPVQFDKDAGKTSRRDSEEEKSK